jgi:sarcosine oxidase delta subunit
VLFCVRQTCTRVEKASFTKSGDAHHARPVGQRGGTH